MQGDDEGVGSEIGGKERDFERAATFDVGGAKREKLGFCNLNNLWPRIKTVGIG